MCAICAVGAVCVYTRLIHLYMHETSICMYILSSTKIVNLHEHTHNDDNIP